MSNSSLISKLDDIVWGYDINVFSLARKLVMECWNPGIAGKWAESKADEYSMLVLRLQRNLLISPQNAEAIQSLQMHYKSVSLRYSLVALACRV